MPPQIQAPVLSPVLADTTVLVDWEAPVDQLELYGAYITNYKVYVQQTDGIFFSEVSTDCPSDDANLLSNTECEIQIPTLKAYPFSLEDGQLVYAKIVAVNVIGESNDSEVATGSTVFTPIVPGAPINLVNNPEGTSKSTASFTWQDSTSGGKVIIDYKIQTDQALGMWTDIATDVTTRSYTATGL